MGVPGVVLPLGSGREEASVEMLVVGHGAGVGPKGTAHQGHNEPEQNPHRADRGHFVRQEGVHRSQVRPFHVGLEAMPHGRSTPHRPRRSTGMCQGWVSPSTISCSHEV